MAVKDGYKEWMQGMGGPSKRFEMYDSRKESIVKRVFLLYLCFNSFNYECFPRHGNLGNFEGLRNRVPPPRLLRKPN